MDAQYTTTQIEFLKMNFDRNVLVEIYNITDYEFICSIKTFFEDLKRVVLENIKGGLSISKINIMK